MSHRTPKPGNSPLHLATGSEAFILTRQWRDSHNGIELSLWASTEQGAVRISVSSQKSLFFIEQDQQFETGIGYERKPVELLTLEGNPVDALYFHSQRDQQQLASQLKAAQIRVYESDIRPVERFLMERFITSSCLLSGQPQQRQAYIEYSNPKLKTTNYHPKLSSVSFDIETDDMHGPIYSIAAIYRDRNKHQQQQIFYLPAPEAPALSDETLSVISYTSEKSMLQGFFNWIREYDPDLILGWNVVNFDLNYLQQRCRQLQIKFDLGRGTENCSILQPQSSQQVAIPRIPGRVVLDGIDTLKSATWSFESFSLDYVARELLGKGKLIDHTQDKVAEIQRMYRQDPDALLRYNLEDAQLVFDIFDHAGLFEFAIERARLTGLTMDRVGGSVAAFDYLYLPRLHRHGYVARDIGDSNDVVSSPGGYVLDSEPGLYNNVLVLDFKSLYPSIIRTFRIDPLGLAQPGEDPIPGFSGGEFSRTESILPEIITQLWSARDEAKQRKDTPLSQAIKIIMNSFYGVLGTPGCRFFSPKLASSITRRGHEIIHRSKEQIEFAGFKVIYGDTDSLFVLLGDDYDEQESKQIGQHLAKQLNHWWSEHIEKEFHIPSYLEIEFETHYSRFVMPTIRGSEKGSKKRYAGLIQDGDDTRMVFKGLETVRTDWTPLARRFQRELYRRVFMQLPYREYIRETAEQLMRGELDGELIYRKRLKRRLDDYIKNVPPHVQAARKLSTSQLKNLGWIEYYISINGPEPDLCLESPLDYEHYLSKQIKPIADGILYFLDENFDEIYNKQMRMF